MRTAKYLKHSSTPNNIWDLCMNEYIKNNVRDYIHNLTYRYIMDRKIDKEAQEIALPRVNLYRYMDIHKFGDKVIDLDREAYKGLQAVYKDIQKKYSKIGTLLRKSYGYPEIVQDIEKDYLDASEEVIHLTVKPDEVLSTVLGIYKNMKDVALYGIIMEIEGKRYNLTHPCVISQLLKEWQYFVDYTHYDINLYVFYNNDKNYMDNITYPQFDDLYTTDELKNELREYMKELITYQLALVDIHNPNEQKTKYTKKMYNYAGKTLFFTDCTHEFMYNDIALKNHFESKVYHPISVEMDTPKNDNITIPMFVPVDLISAFKVMPYYGGIIVNASYNIHDNYVNQELTGENISICRSSNISIDDGMVCTGDIKKFSIERIGSLNYSNANSAYHHETIPTGVGMWIDLNIQTAIEIIKEYNANN